MTVYGMNHVAREVIDIDLAVKFYTEVFGLEKQRGGEGQAVFELGGAPVLGAGAGRSGLRALQ